MYRGAPSDVQRSTWKGVSQPGPVVNQYDPQIGQAALQESQLAQQEQNWTQNYYDQYVTPALQQEEQQSQRSMDLQAQYQQEEQKLAEAEMAAMADNQKNQDAVTAQDLQAQGLALDQYKQYGIPAQDAFFNTVNNYSAPAFQEQQAEAAIGDQRAAAQSNQQTMQRQMAGMGINGSSPAAVAAMSDMAVQNAAAEAAAGTRARQAAQQLGINLQGSAANMASGLGSTALNFGQGASSASAAGASGSAQTGYAGMGALSGAGNMAASSAGIGFQGVGATASGASVPMAGYAGMQNAFGANLNAWSGLGSTSMNQNGANQRAYMQYQAEDAGGWGTGILGFLGKGLGSQGGAAGGGLGFFGLPL